LLRIVRIRNGAIAECWIIINIGDEVLETVRNKGTHFSANALNFLFIEQRNIGQPVFFSLLIKYASATRTPIGGGVGIYIIISSSPAIIHTQVGLNVEIGEEMEFIIQLHVTNQTAYPAGIVAQHQQSYRIAGREVDGCTILLQPFIITTILAAIHRLCGIK